MTSMNGAHLFVTIPTIGGVTLSGPATVAPVATVAAPAAPKAAKGKNPCWCGCGGETARRFVPGHDARFHGWAKKVARDELDGTEIVKMLPHEEAVEEFNRHVELELPKAEAKAKAKQAEKERKEAEKAAKSAPAGATKPELIVAG